MTEETIQQTTLTPEAAATALEIVKKRRASKSFAERNELPAMMNCPVCKLRHRRPQCVQVFAKNKQGKEMSLANLPETKRIVYGAKMFKGKRIKPHLGKRALQFVDLVRKLIPDEYTEKHMKWARKQAALILVKKFGKYQIIPQLWRPNVKSSDNRNQDVPTGPEAI
jgi:hypothetical protein